MKTVKLTNGLVIGNFSSPHSFEFQDGSILPAVSNDEAERLKVTFIEKLTPGLSDTKDCELVFELSYDVKDAMRDWMSLWSDEQVDIVLCCLPMIQAMKEDGYNVKDMPFRSIIMTDRINKKISTCKFGI
jgi:hypothetical protein